MNAKNKSDELLIRVFKMILDSHFRDYKLSKEYCTPIKFDRSVGEDIADYIQGHYPAYYHSKGKEINRIVAEQNFCDKVQEV